MRVFKACFKITRRNLATLAVYLVVFTMLLVVMTMFYSQENTANFETQRPTIAVINRDGDTPLTQSLASYLETTAHVKPLADDKEKITDALLNGAVRCVFIIPNGFTQAFLAGADARLDKMVIQGYADGVYADMIVSRYLQTAALYRTALPGSDWQQIAQHIEDDLNTGAQLELKSLSDTKPLSFTITIFYRMLGYILPVLLILAISTIMISMNRQKIRMRMACSPLRQSAFNTQVGLYTLVVSVGCLLISTLTGLAIYAKDLKGVNGAQLGMLTLNSLCLMLIGMSIAFLAGTFIKKASIQNACANFLALGLSFLGGIFVSASLFSPTMLRIAQFTPLFWYGKAVDDISSITAFTVETLAPVFTSMLIELAFAIAIFAVAVLLIRQRNGTGRQNRKAELAVD